MKQLLCKPCFAFEALASLVFCKHCRNDIPEASEWVENTYHDIFVGPSNHFFDILVEHHSLEEIESFDLDRLIQVYPQYLKEDTYAFTKQFEDMVLQGLRLLKESHFEELWENTLLPVLKRQCENFLNACDSEKISGIIADIEKVHRKPITEDIIVYMTYFTFPISFLVTPTCYFTNAPLNWDWNTGNILALFAHELCHKFAEPKLIEAYKKLCSNSAYLKRSYFFLSRILGESGYEEELVVALEHTIAVKRGLITRDEAFHNLSQMYRNSIPVAIILFSRLESLDCLPEDINGWFCTAINQLANAGQIEAAVNDIIPEYTEKFYVAWNAEKQNRPDLFTI